MENLEKEADKDHNIEIKDEKVFLKPIESDEEPMFGYASSGSEKEEKYKVEQKVEIKI